MKHNFLFSLLLLLFSSCMFNTKVAFITGRKSLPEQQVRYVGEDSIQVTFDGKAFLRYVMRSSCSDSTKNMLRSCLSSTVVSLDSIEMQLNQSNDLDCRDFWVRQLNKGNTYMVDLNTGEQIRLIRKETRYFKGNFFTRRKMFVDYTFRDKLIYEERYLIVDF